MPDLKIPEAQEELKTEQLPEQAPAQAPEETPKKEPWEAPNPKKKVKTAAEKKKLVKRVVAGVTAAAVLGGIIFGMWYWVFRKDDSLGDIYAEPAYIGSIQSTVEGSGNATAKETLGIDNFCDMVADETVTSDAEELLNFLTEKNHPVLNLEPLM